MLTQPQIDPVIVKIGPLAVRWYGLMYLVGFVAAYFIIRALSKQRGHQLDNDTLSDLLFYCVIGVILGGRLGYVVFYNFSHYLNHPIQIFAVWEGGMSFHGGLTGVVVAVLIFCRRRKISPRTLGDQLVIAATVGLGLGRIGNFINGELWGRVTDVPWGVIFPAAGSLPRHPSQLYEAVYEGPILMVLLLLLFYRKVKDGIVFFSFFILYGAGRFVIEFFRQPDEQLGFLWGGATMGQLLCLAMIAIGCGGIITLKKQGLS